MYSPFVTQFCGSIGYVGVSWFKQPLEPYFLYDILMNHAFVSRVIPTQSSDGLTDGYFKFDNFHIVLVTDTSNAVRESTLLVGFELDDLHEFSVLKLKLGEREFIEVDASDATNSSAFSLPDGTQWYGSCLNKKAYGYGKLYDKDHRLIYKGFMFNNKRFCFGYEYDPITSKLLYKGGFVNGKRYGFGELIDVDGNTVQSGKWMEGEFVPQ